MTHGAMGLQMILIWLESLIDNFAACQQALRTWSKEKFGAGVLEIKITMRKLERL
jgi:hypothetical protein